MTERTWCEVDVTRLAGNLAAFRRLVGRSRILAPTVKADAYGHGLLIAARAFLDAGADWLCVDSLGEAATLRDHGIDAPLYVMGYVPLADLETAAALGLRLVLYNRATVEALAEAVPRLPASSLPVKLHLKLETGNNRQGVGLEQALAIADMVTKTPGLELEGLSSHYADIEDTTDHTYAKRQLERFEDMARALWQAGHRVRIRHFSNSAATILWPETYMEMVRLGISAYGMWPSAETQVAAALLGRHDLVDLRPAITWKARIAQVKDVPQGEFVGYGRTYRTTHPTRLAIVPVGYYDGYDRGLSNLAYVLVHGQRAPVRGRVCMNMIMIDVTHVPGVGVEDEVVLLGEQGGDRITAEQMADWLGTINYEITTRIAEHVPRHARRG